MFTFSIKTWYRTCYQVSHILIGESDKHWTKLNSDGGKDCMANKSSSGTEMTGFGEESVKTSMRWWLTAK